MLLRHLELENIRLFKGNHSLDLTPIIAPPGRRPIVIVGGKNGAGKTTLFESVLLCLYGPQFNGPRMSSAKYEHFIRQMISSAGGAGGSGHAFIEIEFEFSHIGRTYVYTVKRYWQVGTKVQEHLTIKRDGKRLTDVEVDQWQEFLNELIPQRFARLFLFDGEKIQNLVDQETTDLYLKDSFKSLLGLDLVERLKADLSIYIARQHRKSGDGELNRELQALEEQHLQFESRLEDMAQERAGLTTQELQIQAAIERDEALLAQEGGGYARKREELKAEKVCLDSEIASTEAAIRDLATGLLPFAITPRYCAQLQERLQAEWQILVVRQSRGILEERLTGLSDELKAESFWTAAGVPAGRTDEIAAKVLALLESQLLQTLPDQAQVLIHQLSDRDHQRLSHWLEMATAEVPETIAMLTDRLETQTLERRRVAEMINRAPPDEAIAPLIQHLNELNQHYGQVLEQQRVKDGEIKAIEFQRTETERKIVRLREQTVQDQTWSKKVSLASATQHALDDYMTELQLEKLSLLQQTLLSCFTRLLRKEDYITDLRINPGDYAITLIDRDGNAIAKDRLSAGEKEIFAISMLWALTLTSGRQLPFIIDTPLGRLDSDHRGNLVMDFFQNAGDQMIIFSTDTEIDRDYFRTLSPHIARAYHLDFSHRTKQTTITPGYFWQLEEVAE